MNAPAAVSPLRRRMIDDMTLPQPVAGHATILPACRDKVQPVFRPLAGAAGTGGCARLPDVPGVAGHLLAGAQPDGLRAAVLLRRDAGPAAAWHPAHLEMIFLG